jgi:hypothetical protein
MLIVHALSPSSRMFSKTYPHTTNVVATCQPSNRQRVGMHARLVGVFTSTFEKGTGHNISAPAQAVRFVAGMFGELGMKTQGL